MRNLKAFVVLVVFLYLEVTGANPTAKDVQRLFTNILDKGNPKIRPIWNQSQQIDVGILVHFVALTDLNEVQQKVEATIWIEVRWMNELLRWNSSDYNGLETVYPKPETMWKPDLAITNGYNELNPVGLDFVNIKMRNNGLVHWFPGQKVEFLCKIDVSNFPFDTQHCYMDFFNWGGTKEESTLNFLEDAYKMSTEALHPNSEWSILDRRYQKLNTKAHETVRIHLTLKRKSLSLVLTVLLPVFLLSFLNVFVFLLPTESGEKLSFAITVLLSQAVFLSFISGLMPQTSDTISGLSIFISVQLILSTIYVLLTCFSIRIYHRNTTKRPLPKWFVKLMCFQQANDVCPLKQSSTDGSLKEGATVTGIELSQRWDKICFWLFFASVILIITLYLFNGMS